MDAIELIPQPPADKRDIKISLGNSRSVDVSGVDSVWIDGVQISFEALWSIVNPDERRVLAFKRVGDSIQVTGWDLRAYEVKPRDG